MTLSLELTQLEGEESILDKEDEDIAGHCNNWLLDPQEGSLRPEDEDPCLHCSKTLKTLVLECVQQTAAGHQQVYWSSQTGDGNELLLVHGAGSFCPHCGRPKAEHIVRMVTKVAQIKMLKRPG